MPWAPKGSAHHMPGGLSVAFTAELHIRTVPLAHQTVASVTPPQVALMDDFK